MGFRKLELKNRVIKSSYALFYLFYLFQFFNPHQLNGKIITK